LYFFLVALFSLVFPATIEAQDVFFYDDFDSHRESWQILSQEWEIASLHGNNALERLFNRGVFL